MNPEIGFLISLDFHAYQGWIFGLSSCESSPRRKQTDEVTAARTDAQNTERRKQLQNLKSTTISSFQLTDGLHHLSF